MAGLKDYIMVQKSKGFSDEAIRNFLLGHGYSIEDVDHAFLELRKHRDDKHAKKNFVLAVMAILIIISGVLMLFKIDSAAQDHNFIARTLVADDKEIFSDNDTLVFSSYFHTSKECDASISYQVRKGESDIVLQKETEKRLVSGMTDSFKGSFDLITLEPGDYELFVRIVCGKMEESSTTIFKIEDDDNGAGSNGDPSLLAGENATGPADVTGLTDISDTANATANTANSTDYTGNASLAENISLSSIINPDMDTLVKAALADKQKAIGLCLEFHEHQIDDCLKQLAARLNDSSFCDEIEDVPIKDACYAESALEGDNSGCSKISDEYTRDACELILANNDIGGDGELNSTMQVNISGTSNQDDDEYTNSSSDAYIDQGNSTEDSPTAS